MCIQAVDVDTLRAEGLDLDVVDQMKDLALAGDEAGDGAGDEAGDDAGDDAGDEAGDEAEGHTGKTDVMAAFEPSAPSTKVNIPYNKIQNLLITRQLVQANICIIILPPVVVQSIVMSVSVCLDLPL